MPTLLLRPSPLHLETLSSYVYRLATANHYPNPGWICEMAGLQGRTLDTIGDPSDLTGLASMTGLPRESLFALTLPGRLGDPLEQPASSRKRTVQSIGRYDLQGSTYRVCPACMAATSYLHLPWLVRAITGCPRHGLLLADTCVCDRPLRYPAVMRGCECGATVHRLRCEVLDPVGHRTVQFMSWLYGFESGGPAVSYPYEEIGRESLLTLVNVLRRWVPFTLGEDVPHSHQYRQPGPKRRIESASVLVGHQLSSEVYCLLEEWPGNFFSLLDRQRIVSSQKKTKHRTGISRDFPVLRTLAMRYLDPDVFAPFYRAFRTYLSANWDGGHVGRLGSLASEKERARSRHYITLNQAKEILGCDISRVKEVISCGTLNARVLVDDKEAERMQVLVELRSCQELAETWSRQLTLPDACKFLGVSRDTVRRLAKKGLIAPPKLPRYKQEFCCEDGELRLLLTRLSERCVESTAETGWQSLTKGRVSPWRAVILALEGRVAVRRTAGDGLQAFEVYVGDVRSSDKAKRGEGLGLPIAGVARRTGMPRVLIREAVTAGILQPTLVNGQGSFFSFDLIDEFRTTYVDADQAREILGLPRVTFGRWLRRGTIIPVLSTNRKFRKHLFLRKDVEAKRQQPGTGTEEHNGNGTDLLPGEEGPAELDAVIDTKQAARLLHVSTGYITKEARAGRLPVVARTTSDGRGLRFRTADVLALTPSGSRPNRHTFPVVTVPNKTGFADGDLWTTEDVATYLEVSENTVRAWVQNGYLQCHRKEWPSGKMFFASGVVKRIPPRSHSISRGEAVKQFGLTIRQLVKLRQRGLLIPVEGPEINGLSYYRYRIEDLRRVLLQVRSKGTNKNRNRE